MIYDLKELREQLKSLMPSYVGNDEKLVALVKCFGFDALLAIAERLEALVDAQKPRLVEFEMFPFTGETSKSCFISPSGVLSVSMRRYNIAPGEYGEYVGISTTDNDHDRDEHWAVKGTLSEVLAKIRGEA